MKRKQMCLSDKKGFTLIELLIVIAIIGILASIVLVSLSQGRDKAQVSTYKSQVSSLKAALITACASGNETLVFDETYVTSLLPAEDNKINGASATVVSEDCANSGEFEVTIRSVDLGEGAQCDASDTIITNVGATFPESC